MPNPIRRRRLGGGAGFTPKSLGGLVFWVKADTLGLADGTAVATWADQSGSSNDLTQATAGNRPAFKVGIQNGLPVVRFTGTTDQWLDTPNFTLSQPLTLCAVFAENTPLNRYLSDAESAKDKRTIVIQGHTTLQMFAGAVFNTTVTTMQNTFNSAVLVYNGASSINNFNGAETTGDVGAGNGTGIRLGGSGGLDAFVKTADVGEFCAYNRALNASERSQVQAYLKRRWATP